MAVTTIRSTRDVGKIINDLMYDKGFNNWTYDGLWSFSIRNMSLTGAAREIRGVMRKYGKEQNIEAYVIVQSFAEEELNPESQEDLDKANEAGMRLARKYGGDDRQVMVVTQTDNGKVYNHILLANIDTLTAKALRGAKTGHLLLKQYSDEILKEMGIENKNANYRRAYNRQTMAEIKIRERGEYVWKDDLKSRIQKSLRKKDVIDVQSFVSDMEEENVNVWVNKNGNISYRFIDTKGNDRICRASKLGSAFGKEGLSIVFEEKQKK